MPKRRYLKLNEAQKQALEQVRDSHEKAHMREKAAVLLKIAAGMTPHQAALKGGLKERHPDTIYSWMDKYEAGGIEALQVRSGRGRKPAFSP